MVLIAKEKDETFGGDAATMATVYRYRSTPYRTDFTEAFSKMAAMVFL